MKFKTLKDLGRFAAEEIRDIKSGDVPFEQSGSAETGYALTIGLAALHQYAIPVQSVLSVVVKDNFLHDRTVIEGGRTWGEVSLQGDVLKIPLAAPLVAAKTEISLVFTRPGDSKIVAATPGLRLPDEETLEWMGGKSFFRTRPDRSLSRPVTPVMDPDGPLFLLGVTGPRNGEEARLDPNFVARDAIHGVEKFVTHLLLRDHEDYVGQYWDAFKLKVARLAGKKDFAEFKAASQGRVEEAAMDVCEAFFRSKKFMALVKELIEAREGRNEGND